MTVPVDPSRRRLRTAGALVVGYLVVTVGLGGLLEGLAGERDATSRLVLGHVIPVTIAVGGLLLHVWWVGDQAAVWRERSTLAMSPRRPWLLAFPVLLALLPVLGAMSVAWGAIPATTVLVVAVSTGLVGVGEELLIRGVLLVAVRARHGELAALGITSGAFALGHVPGSLVGGMPAPELALQVAYLAVVGAACLWTRRVTGRLWPVVVVHAAVDATVLLGAASGSAPAALPVPEQTAAVVLAVVQSLLVVAVAAGCVSARREDRRAAAAAALPAEALPAAAPTEHAPEQHGATPGD